jgi:hypothetical protein
MVVFRGMCCGITEWCSLLLLDLASVLESGWVPVRSIANSATLAAMMVSRQLPGG